MKFRIGDRVRCGREIVEVVAFRKCRTRGCILPVIRDSRGERFALPEQLRMEAGEQLSLFSPSPLEEPPDPTADPWETDNQAIAAARAVLLENPELAGDCDLAEQVIALAIAPLPPLPPDLVEELCKSSLLLDMQV